MTDHTAMPWAVDVAEPVYEPRVGTLKTIWGPEGEGMGAIAYATDDYYGDIEANAAFIVKACNRDHLFDELAETLSEVLNKVNITGYTDDHPVPVLWAQARAVLAKAQEDSD